MEILGLLDVLESTILDGVKIPFTKKMLINDEKVLDIIDKMRVVGQGKSGMAKEAISGKAVPATFTDDNDENVAFKAKDETKAVEVLQQAYQMAKEIREGADKYADEVLANLEATSTRILRTVRAGRERLDKTAPEKAAEKPVGVFGK